ncbi:MAG: phospho-sugar mutase [Ilumatobacteraceae bacterium]|nr:phospho-sugar mutase [Ilumatobacteraceae bacterium]
MSRGLSRDMAEKWLLAEPDEDMRQELQALIDGSGQELDERFSGRLMFGTAGLRAEVGAGPNRMNRLVVRQAAAGLVDYLLRGVEGSAEAGILIGFDARRKSDVFAFDTARVAAARGMKAMLLPQLLPTPVLAWNISRIGVAAGVMVTASHNPPQDNGYKVYLGSGAQIVPPHDELISDAIESFDATSIELASEDSPLIQILGDECIDEYIKWLPSVRLCRDVPRIKVAYTAMHGVGGDTALRAFASAGFDQPVVVASQQEPDGSFPTVSFPNPEEPGAMDLVIDLARRSGAAIALANDPDADRLGVAIPVTGETSGEWRLLRGDEIGWLLGDHILRHTNGDDRLVVTTLVSSSLLGKMAHKHGVAFEETFTGFKWIADAAMKRSDKRLVFAYEQALGYLVADQPLDKDGISAALVMTEIATLAVHDGVTVQQRLDQIAAEYGQHVTAELSVKMSPSDGAAVVEELRANPPMMIGGRQVVGVEDFPEANLLRLWLDEVGGRGVRLQIRPSGTEPKVKLYGEAVDMNESELQKLLAALAPN